MKYIINLNGKKYEVEVERGQAEIVSITDAPAAVAAAPVAPVPVAAPAPLVAPAPVAVAPLSGEQITSPMPGSILDVKVTVGQAVNSGDILLILEAMKMENEILAPKAGKVAQILTNKGATVQTGDVLIVIA